MPLLDLKIRSAVPGDLDAGCALVLDACADSQFARFLDARYGSEAEALALLQRCLPWALVAEQRSETIGLLTWRQDEFIGVVDVVVMRSDRRRWGGGTALLDHAVEGLQKAGLRTVEITVDAALPGASRLCLRSGFRETGRIVCLQTCVDGMPRRVTVPAEDPDRVRAREATGFEQISTWIHYEKRLMGAP